MPVEPVRPVDLQVARPEAAPNYVGMYSQRVQAALEPFKYLLDYQKNLGEEDVRKAEIQNYLNEYNAKEQEIAETGRHNLADEALSNLTREQEGRKLDEDVRHNQAAEGIERDRTAVDTRRADIEDRRADIDSKREELEQKKNDFEQSHWQDQFDVYKKSQDAAQAKDTADAKRVQSEADKVKTDNDNRAADQQVIGQVRDWLKQQDATPEKIFNVEDNPELANFIAENRSKLTSDEARRQLDEMVGSDAVVGKEIYQRNILDTKMGNEARSVFLDEMHNSVGNGKTSQQRFNAAFQEAQYEQTRAEARAKWTTPGAMDAYKNTLAATKDKNAGMLAGDAAEARFQAEMKQKEKPLALEDIAAMIPQKPGENKTAFDLRQQQEASRLFGIYSTNREQFGPELEKVQQEASGDKSASFFLRHPEFMHSQPAKPGPSTQPAQTQPTPKQTPTTPPAGGQQPNKPYVLPGFGAAGSAALPGRQLAMGTSAVAPTEEAEFRASTDNEELENAFDQLLGPKAPPAGSTLPITTV